jgi:hypothetical protein
VTSKKQKRLLEMFELRFFRIMVRMDVDSAREHSAVYQGRPQ